MVLNYYFSEYIEPLSFHPEPFVFKDYIALRNDAKNTFPKLFNRKASYKEL